MTSTACPTSMVLDTSALLAILLREPEAELFARLIEEDPTRLLSAANYLETAMVIETRRGPEGGRDLDLLLHRTRAEVVALTLEQAELARAAWRRYGKGRHPAGLNFGDCMAYALAQHSGERLLAKGADFARTDVARAWPE
ncbi:MAG TPA: type II toxin-antitoxin system VapC family toxin [Terriglobales bacterium]|nr:type II toxin-antitoxin system VapC family toxin [Terriglobales bacterium]